MLTKNKLKHIYYDKDNIDGKVGVQHDQAAQNWRSTSSKSSTVFFYLFIFPRQPFFFVGVVCFIMLLVFIGKIARLKQSSASDHFCTK